MIARFQHALDGLKAALKDHSVRLQMYLGLAAVLIGFLLHLEQGEWLAVAVCIGTVISTEIINTCLERLCDLYTEKKDERVRLIKDMSAGAVLLASCMAAVIGMMILFSHIGR